MNTAGRLVLLVLAILVAIALLTITIVYSVVPKNTDTGPTQPIQNPNFSIPSGINQSYANTPSGTFQVNDNKPFVVQSRREPVTMCSFLFSNMPFAKVTQAMSTGFWFYVTQEQIVVSLQCIDQYFLSGERQVGIFEVGRRTQLISAPVSKTAGGLVQGLRTHALLYSEQVHLFPGIMYACLGQVNVDDYTSLENVNGALFTNNITFSGTCSVLGPTLTLPSTFNPSTFKTSPFPGFQTRNVTPLNFVPTFRVDTQSASMPIHFIADLNLETFETGLRVSAGACASQSGVYNIEFFKPTVVVTNGMGLDANAWYAVYATNSTPAIILSQNFPQPTLSQSELARLSFRRIGFVQTSTDPNKLVSVVQTGPETLRTTTFKNPSEFAQVVELKQDLVFTLPLTMVAPTATVCTVQIELEFENTPTPNTPGITLTFGNFSSVLFRADQTYQIQQTLFQLSSTYVPRAMAVSCAFESSTSTEIPRATFTVLNFTEDI